MFQVPIIYTNRTGECGLFNQQHASTPTTPPPVTTSIPMANSLAMATSGGGSSTSKGSTQQQLAQTMVSDLEGVTIERVGKLAFGPMPKVDADESDFAYRGGISVDHGGHSYKLVYDDEQEVLKLELEGRGSQLINEILTSAMEDPEGFLSGCGNIELSVRRPKIASPRPQYGEPKVSYETTTEDFEFEDYLHRDSLRLEIPLKKGFTEASIKFKSRIGTAPQF